jgi:hypothetical protein
MCVILDISSIHRVEASRTRISPLDVILQFIPTEWTDEPPSLGRHMFGALKAICRRLFVHHCKAAEDAAVALSDTVPFLLEGWPAFEVAVVEKGWGIQEDELGDPPDGHDEEDLA